jgi:hypothetical protein
MVNQVLILREEVSRWGSIVVRAEDRGILAVCQGLPNPASCIDPGHNISVDEPQEISVGLMGSCVSRHSWTMRAFAWNDPRPSCCSHFARVVGRAVIHHNDLANLAAALHLEQRRQTSLDHGPAIIGWHDNRNGGVNIGRNGRRKFQRISRPCGRYVPYPHSQPQGATRSELTIP